MAGGFINRREVLGAGIGMATAASLPGMAFAAAKAKAPKLAAKSTVLNDRLLLVSGLGGNIVALKGGEGLLLVDTGAPDATSKLQGELKKFARGAAVHTVINTHWHAPQTGGNEIFGKAGVKIIAHAKTKQRLAIDQYVPAEDRYIKAAPKAAVPTEIFYLGKRELTFGGERIEYGYLQQPHTDGDLYVWFRDSNVLVVGDAASPEQDPVLAWFEGGWVGGCVDSQTKLLDMADAATRIVAGTGGVFGRSVLQVERDAMATVFDRVSDTMRKGFTTEDMQKAKILDGLPRTWADPDTFIYAAHKGMWAHYNKLSHTIV